MLWRKRDLCKFSNWSIHRGITCRFFNYARARVYVWSGERACSAQVSQASLRRHLQQSNVRSRFSSVRSPKQESALSGPHLNVRTLLLGILSHLDGYVPVDVFHFSQHGWHQGGLPRAHSTHHSHQLAWRNVQVHTEKEKSIWRRWGELFKSKSGYFSDYPWEVWY